MIMIFEVVPKEFLGLLDLPGAQALTIHKTGMIIVIGQDEDLVFATF